MAVPGRPQELSVRAHHPSLASQYTNRLVSAHRNGEGLHRCSRVLRLQVRGAPEGFAIHVTSGKFKGQGSYRERPGIQHEMPRTNATYLQASIFAIAQWKRVQEMRRLPKIDAR